MKRIVLTAVTLAVLSSAAWFLVRPSEVHAAGEIIFLKPWKIRVRGGGPQAAADSNDGASTTTITFDPGLSAGAGKRTAKLTAKRKFTVTEDQTLVRVDQDARLRFTDGIAAADVTVRRGKVVVLAHPVIRDASPGVSVFDFNWFRSLELPAGKYTIVVTVLYKRSKTGSFGDAAPADPPHEIKLSVGP